MKFILVTLTATFVCLIFAKNIEEEVNINSLTEFESIKSLIHEEEGELKKALLCGSCRTIFYTLKKFMHSELAIKIGAVAICRLFDFANPSDCTGYASLFAPHLSYIIKNTNLTASQMCGILMGKKCLSSPPSKYETWKIPLPPQYPIKQSNQAKQVQKSKVRILHLSDFHFDPLYKPGAVTDCPQKICCREMSKGKGSAGYWGHTTNCDAPLPLLKNMVNHLNASHATDYDLLFWTGDNNPHDDWMTTADSIVFTSTMTTNLIKKHLSNGKIVFPILGNHEGMPANQYVLGNISQFDTQWLYSELAKQWKEWIETEEAIATFKFGGYYSKKVGKKLKVISMNTNLCARINLWTLYEPIDPANQLQWLVKELTLSEKRKEHVYILGHIPPDVECTEIWFHNFIRITKRFRHTIKGFFYGHTHRDEFKLYYSNKNQSDVMHVAHLGPSVVTFNPGYKFYSLNDDYTVENIHSYYLNLTKANIEGKAAKLNWQKLYEAKKDYGLKTLSPIEWDQFYRNLLKNDTLCQIYYKNVIRHSGSFSNVCDEKCKKGLILGPIPQHDYFDAK